MNISHMLAFLKLHTANSTCVISVKAPAPAPAPARVPHPRDPDIISPKTTHPLVQTTLLAETPRNIRSSATAHTTSKSQHHAATASLTSQSTRARYSTMFTVSFLPRSPKHPVVGTPLSQTPHLLTRTSSLLKSVTRQRAAIAELPQHPEFSTHLFAITSHHSAISTALGGLVIATQDAPRESWVRELQDVHVGMRGKVTAGTRRRWGKGRNWVVWTWEGVGMLLARLEGLLARVRRELEGKGEGKEEEGVVKKKKGRGKKVAFETNVKARLIGGDEGQHGKEVLLKLTTDKKRTAGRCQKRKGVKKDPGSVVEANLSMADKASDDNDKEEEETDEEYEGTFTPLGMVHAIAGITLDS